MNEILLITTKGCEGCSIMNNNIKEAISRTSKDITYVRKDFSELDSNFIKQHKIKDFPTVLFIKNDIITRKEIGTKPTIVVLRWIDIDFK